MVITSSSNEKVKKLRALCKDGKIRRELREFVVEGETIVRSVPGDRIKRTYIRERDLEKFLSTFGKKEYYVLSDGVFDSVAETKNPSGIIAIADMPEQRELSGDRVVLLCGVSDPGNVGTIIRTACAAGIADIILADTADPFSPKVVRATMGGIFGLNIISTDIDSALDMLKKYDIVSLDMGGNSIYEYKRTKKIAIAVGNEAHGVPEKVKNASTAIISIPMKENSVESLNASVAAGIAIYLIK